MNWREQVSGSIPCFGIRFSAVLYITNAPSIQMIQLILGSPVVYQFYDMRFFVREASFPPRLLIFVMQIQARSLKLWCVLYFMNEKFNKNAKVEKLTKKVGRGVRLIVIGLRQTQDKDFSCALPLTGGKH